MAVDSFMKDHLSRYGYVYKAGVLTPDRHYQLVEDLPKFAQVAGVDERYVYQSMLDFTEGAEVDWMRDYQENKRKNILGLCMVGTNKTIIRMSAMVGCCMRNEINGRILAIHSLLQELKEGRMPSEDMVAIPNFCLGLKSGGGVAQWSVPSIMSFLYERAMKHKTTVIYTEKLTDLKEVFGQGALDHINEYFTMVTD